jgi:hypothetical protein
MTTKSFKTYAPTVQNAIELNDRSFPIQFVPGAVVLDFLANADADNPAKMALSVHGLLDAAIVPEQLDEWHTYIRDPRNNVDLNTLSEIAGYVAEVVTAGNPHQQPLSSLSG